MMIATMYLNASPQSEEDYDPSSKRRRTKEPEEPRKRTRFDMPTRISQPVFRNLQSFCESYNEHVPPGKRYSFNQVVRHQRINGRKLGHITNTTRYYPRHALQKDGIKHVKEINQENVKMSNDDILGDEIPHYQEDAYRKFCYEMLYPNEKRRGMHFSGSHPVSFNRESLRLLRQRYYYATWKADGTRYMMLLTKDGCYLIDRQFRFRRVQMRFPRKVITDKVHDYTLLEGEMIIDNPKDGHEGQARRRYLIYDMIAINGESIVERTFCERWNILLKEVIEPRDVDKGISRNWYRYDLEPFGVRIKCFYLLSAVEKLLKVTIPSLSHEADGLIFQCWDDPYVPLTHEGLLKWKYAEMNSLDFLFEMDENDGRQMLFLLERGKKKLMEGYSVEFRGGDSNPAFYSGKIIECSWDKEKQVWVFMRIRVDKAIPNDLGVASKVIKSITDDINEQVLLQEIREIIRLPMYVERIRADLGAARRR